MYLNNNNNAWSQVRAWRLELSGIVIVMTSLYASTPYVGWVYFWFSPLPREVFLRVLRFSPLLKKQHLQIQIRSGTHGHV